MTTARKVTTADKKFVTLSKKAQPYKETVEKYLEEDECCTESDYDEVYNDALINALRSIIGENGAYANILSILREIKYELSGPQSPQKEEADDIQSPWQGLVQAMWKTKEQYTSLNIEALNLVLEIKKCIGK